MATNKKAAVTTGCRQCPADGQCELQRLAELLNVTELDFPIDYRGLAVSKDDPFIEADLNLCVLCGRCVRVCRDVNGADILAFQHRGETTVVGPAFGRTYLEAGCEFCGECLTVCPSGALYEKVRKWEGGPEREEVTTCPLCGVGCQVRLLIKGDKIIGSLPAKGPVLSASRLCVKGRFCLTELLNSRKRLEKPYRTENGRKIDIQWEEAVELAAEKILACDPNHFGMIVSSSCTSEDLYIAQKFARAAVGSNNVDTDASRFYGTAFGAYADLMGVSVPLSDLSRASAILCIGLDTRLEQSVVGAQIRRAMEKGAKLVTINSREHSLSAIADAWLRPAPGAEVLYLDALCDATRRAGTRRSRSQAEYRELTFELPAAAGMLMGASGAVVVVGSGVLYRDDSPRMLKAASVIARNLGAGVITLPGQANLYGSILMGAYPELLPGGLSSADRDKRNELLRFWNDDLPEGSRSWSFGRFVSNPDLRVLYLIGDVPTNGTPYSFTIFQNSHLVDSLTQPQLVLPSAAFAEADGTFINAEGRIQSVRKSVDPPGEALPDWEILCRIARKMGKRGFEFGGAREIKEEIGCLIDAFGDLEGAARRAAALNVEGRLFLPPDQQNGSVASDIPTEPDDAYPYVLTMSIEEHIYKGFGLRHWVSGAGMLFPHGVVEMNSKDAAGANLSNGDVIVVTASHFERDWPVRVVSEQPSGLLHVVLSGEDVPRPNPVPVTIRKKNV